MNLVLRLSEPSLRQCPPRARHRKVARLAVLAAATLLSAWAQTPPATPAPAAQEAKPAPDNKPAEFVGSTTCQGCHEDIFNAFQKNPHQVVETDKKRGFAEKSCE